MNELKEYTEKMFEDIKHIDEEEKEYWLARELQVALEYKKWDNFHKAIKQAMISCKNSDVDICGQFLETGKLSINVNGGKRRIIDYKLKNIEDEEYKKQLKIYREYIEDKTNKKVYTYLYSIRDNKLLEIM